MYCLSPPLEDVPRGDWFCPNCIAAANDAEDIGFNSGKAFTMVGAVRVCVWNYNTFLPVESS
jgi:hypothetical protein